MMRKLGFLGMWNHASSLLVMRLLMQWRLDVVKVGMVNELVGPNSTIHAALHEASKLGTRKLSSK